MTDASIPARDVAALAALLEAEGNTEIREADPGKVTFESLLGYGDGLKHAAERLRELAEAAPVAAVPAITEAIRNAAPEQFGDVIREATDATLAPRLAEVEAAARASERERIRAAAEGLKITLFRPGNGPAQTQAFEVVPLADLLGLLAPAEASP